MRRRPALGLWLGLRGARRRPLVADSGGSAPPSGDTGLRVYGVDTFVRGVGIFFPGDAPPTGLRIYGADAYVRGVGIFFDTGSTDLLVRGAPVTVRGQTLTVQGA